MRLLLTLAYDGSRFGGWQSQPGGQTVQDALERAFAALCGQRIAVHGSGRTDAGVHAGGQRAHADVPEGRLPLATWLPALNAHLPEGARVMTLKKVSSDFHARFSATGKTYRYTVWNGPAMPPLLLARSWHVPWKLDIRLMREACEVFAGRHDFAAFSAKRSKREEQTVRTLTAIRLKKSGPLITFTLEGEGFLYKMARILVASIVRCAAGKISLAEIRARLSDAGPRLHHVAPAGGLCLARVVYSRKPVIRADVCARAPRREK